MKKILSLLSFLMLAVVAMAADLATGVTFKGTWSSPLLSDPIEGQMTVTKVDGGLKFEVKSYAFKGTAIPDYVINYEGGVGDDGSFSNTAFTKATDFGETTAEGTALAPVDAYWQKYNGTVTNEAITLTMNYFGYGYYDCANVTFTGTAVAGETPSTPEPKAYKNVLNIVRVNDAKISYPNAEVLVLDKGEGKYAVTLPEFADLDEIVDNCIGKLTFEADGVEEEGKIKLTANNVVTGTPEGGSVDWTTATFSVEMDATIEGETIVGKITLKLVNGDPADGYEYTLTFGEEEETPQPTAQNFSENWESTAGGTGNTTVEILTYEDGKVTMSTKVEDCDIKADNLTQGTDDKGRVTYTGKAKNLVNNVEYNVNAVVYGEATQPHIYMTLTTEWKFVYTIGENPDKDPNEVVAEKTYTDNLTVGHDAQTGEVKGYADKQVVFTKYANGESSVTFKEYPISETETRDLTFRGTITETDMSEDGMGIVTFGEDLAMTPIEDATSAFYGKEISLFINISSYTAEKMEFTYEFGSEDGIYYVGQYGVEIEKPDEIVGSKTYTSNLSVDHDINLENEAVYENKQVKFDKYANGDVAVTFVAYPVSENETCDLSFRGKIMENDMGPMGKFIYGDNLVCKVENETSSFNGKTLYLNINMKLKEDGSPTFSYTFANNEEGEGAESIYYCGRFNFDNGVVGINGIETEMENGNVSIYTVGGAKLNTLHKGINIVRLANGKTIKVIK